LPNYDICIERRQNDIDAAQLQTSEMLLLLLHLDDGHLTFGPVGKR